MNSEYRLLKLVREMIVDNKLCVCVSVTVSDMQPTCDDAVIDENGNLSAIDNDDNYPLSHIVNVDSYSERGVELMVVEYLNDETTSFIDNQQPTNTSMIDADDDENLFKKPMIMPCSLTLDSCPSMFVENAADCYQSPPYFVNCPYDALPDGDDSRPIRSMPTPIRNYMVSPTIETVCDQKGIPRTDTPAKNYLDKKRQQSQSSSVSFDR